MRWLPLVMFLACAGPKPAARPDPARTGFRMVHQVAAEHAGETHVMLGRMLGRPDGSFRVSATSAMGPRLFDVARVAGQWQTKTHFAPLAERLDARLIGRDIR